MSEADADRLVNVELRELPIPLHARAQAHGDELTREFRLLVEQLREEPGGHIPTRLIQLVDTLNSTYAMFTEEQEDALEAAVAAQLSSIDLTYLVPAHAAGAAAELGRMLDEADDFCREGQHLLTLATPADCVAYRAWFLDEFVRQAAGGPATPWPESEQARQLESIG